MTDSWTDPVTGEEFERDPAVEEVPRPSRTLADEDPVEDKPRLKELLEEDPRWKHPTTVTGPPLQFHPETVSEELQRQMTEREQLRADELKHLTELRDRVQAGIDDGRIDLYGGTEMLLNISKARMALAGVGVYPGAW